MSHAKTASSTVRPFSSFEWMLAGRYLRARRKEGFISVIAILSFAGIMLGVAVLIIVMAVMNGFRTELLDKILGFKGHIVIQGQGLVLEEYQSIAGIVRGIDGVVRVTPLVEGQVMAQGGDAMSGALVRGVSEHSLRQIDLVADNMVAGTLDDFKGGHSIVVGSGLAGALRLGLGDRLTILSPRGPATAFGTAPRRKAYTIVGVFQVGMSDFDNAVIFMPLPQAQLFFNYRNGVNALEIMVEDPDRVRDQKIEIFETLGMPLRIYDWQQVNQTLVSALVVERNVMFLILTMIILIAALNVISGMIMLVKDKAGGIAILRTMGASRGTIMRVFFIAGASIGIAGTLTGFGLGVIVSSNIEAVRQFIIFVTGAELFSPEVYFLSEMPADMNNNETLAVVLMALVLSILATLYPSWKAARVDPVEALRYE
jgi:lipoprotein-releasing system permease protein